ncbi:MAG: hypothetical protein KTR28_04575 [Micavibrio sp.]|nr:hypothetical protein [Micavibrio sp.]
MQKFKYSLFRVFVRVLATFKLYSVLANFSIRFVQEHDGKAFIPFQSKKNDNIGLLFFDSFKFRGEVEIFAHASDIQVLSISWGFLDLLMRSFVKIPDVKKMTINGRAATEFEIYMYGEQCAAGRQAYQNFLRKFIPALYKKLGVDVTINSNCRYLNDMDFVYIGEEIGYRHICYYREALHISHVEYERAQQRLVRFREEYPATFIAVQNNITKDVFLNSKKVEEHQVVVRGSPRMDALVKELRGARKNSSHKQIALFSGPPEVIYFDDYDKETGLRKPGASKKTIEFEPYMIDALRTLTEMALADPSLIIIVKMKDLHMKGENEGLLGKFKNTVSEVIGTDEIPENIHFETGMMAAHSVIAESDIVIGIQSTVLLEAAVARKPVVLLHYDSLKNTPDSHLVLAYKNLEGLFDVPRDAGDMEDIIQRRLRNPEIDPDIQEARDEAFDNYVSSLGESALERSLEIVRKAASLKHAH